MIPIAHNVPFELQLYHKHPTLQYRIKGCFGTWKTPTQKLVNISPVCACGKRFTSVVFKNGRNRCRISGRKAALHW